jgi:hypothetical protein
MVSLSSITENVSLRRLMPLGAFATVARSCRMSSGLTFSSL